MKYLENKCNFLEQALAQEKKAKKHLLQEVERLQKENERLNNTVSVLTEEKKESIERGKKLNIEISKFEEKLRQISPLKSKINVLEKQCEKSCLSKSKTYKENTSLRKKLDHLESERKLNHSEQSGLEEKILSLTQSLNVIQAELEVEKKATGNLKNKVKLLQTTKCKLAKQLEKQNKMLNEKEKELEECDDKLEFALKSLNTNFDTFELRERGRGRKFTDAIRLTYMALQGDTNVSAENCSSVVQIVAKNLFGIELDKIMLPKASSASTFQDEAHVVSKQQVYEEIQSCKHFTFACDGTSRDKEHFLEQHIVLDNGTQLSLGFSKIAADNSDTLLECCIDIFRELCDVSQAVENTQKDDEGLLKDILVKLKCLLSDRAEVMKCFDSKFSAFKQSLLEGEDATTHFIFCNAHFLLGLFSAAEKAIKEIEDVEIENGGKLGRDSVLEFSRFQDSSELSALRVIRLASEVLGPRGDEKSGCRFEWLSFCSTLGKKSTFSSYRTNRFNNVFHNATALLLHKEDILTFLDGFASNNNLKLRSIAEDMQDDRIMSIITALSLFHLYFTEPYWALMNSDKTHGDFPKFVQMMKEKLAAWLSEDLDIMSFSSVFSEFEAVVPEHYSQLLESCSQNSVRKHFQKIVEQCTLVFRRQLKDFLPGGVFGGEIDPAIMDILHTCPLTNLTGERLFGDLDFDKMHRRNASLFSSSTKVMWKRNKSYRWISKQSSGRKRRLFEKAKELGPEWRKRARQSEEQVMNKVKKRMEENKEKKVANELKKSEQKKEVFDWVLQHGGLCSNKYDLDQLMKKSCKLKHLKYQIKARKFMYGVSIKCTGNINALYQRLLQQFDHDKPSTSTAPPTKRTKFVDDSDRSTSDTDTDSN